MRVKPNVGFTIQYSLRWSNRVEIDLRKQTGISFILSLPDDTTVRLTSCGYDAFRNKVWVRIPAIHTVQEGQYKGVLSVMTKDLQMVSTGLHVIAEVDADASGVYQNVLLSLDVTSIDTPVNIGQGYSPKIVNGEWVVFDDSQQAYVPTGQSVVATEYVDEALEAEAEARQQGISDLESSLQSSLSSEVSRAQAKEAALEAKVDEVIHQVKSLNRITISDGGEITFDEITLSRNGDSVEFELSTSVGQPLKGLAFSQYNGIPAIAVISYVVGCKDSSNNWLDGMNTTNGQKSFTSFGTLETRGKLSLKWENGVVNVYKDNNLIHTVNSQPEVKINSLGVKYTHSTGDYYWNGTIYSFDYTRDGVKKSIIDFGHLSYNNNVEVDYSTSETGRLVELEKKTLDTELREVEVETVLNKTSDTFSKEEGVYVTGTGIGYQSINNTYWFIADRALKLYTTTTTSSTGLFRMLVGSGTLQSHTNRLYASSASSTFPSEEDAWEIAEGELFALTCHTNDESFEVVVVETIEKKYIINASIDGLDGIKDDIAHLKDSIGKSMLVKKIDNTSFNLFIKSKTGRILRYLWRLRSYSRDINGSSIVCGNVWNNEMIYDEDGNSIIQGNSNFIFAIDGEKSGFANESKDYHAGPGHGCEVAEFFSFFADGKLIDLATFDEIECDSFRFIQASNVYAVDAEKSAEEGTGNANNYPVMQNGTPLKSAHHFIDMEFMADNEINWYNKLTVLRDGTVFNNLSAAMLQCYPVAFNKVCINDEASSVESFTSSQSHNVENGEGIISYAPKKAFKETMYGSDIIVKQVIESINPDRYGKMTLFTPPSYSDRIKTYFFPCLTSLSSGYETFNNGYSFDINVRRKIDC